MGIRSICFDSRKANTGCLFVAVKGIHTDGHRYIDQAIEKGAAAVVCEKLPEKLPENVTFISVENSAKALGIIVSNFYDNPSTRIKLVGVTGTNGKTTIATLLYKLYHELGYKAGLISTISNRIHERISGATHTTPDPLMLHQLLDQMVREGCSHCFMEVSSHAIDQHRIEGVMFSGGIFTNITHDHLDYHHTFRNYLNVKKCFFDSLPADAFALTNIDDRNGSMIIQNSKAKVCTYSIRTMADYRCRIIENQLDGLHLQIGSREAWFKLSGIFNAYNLLAVFATACLLGEKEEEVLTLLTNLGAVEGRFECIKSADDIIAIVDYAHTPDALANVLQTIASVRSRNEVLITVVGAGGDRDKEKRPLMGQIAGHQSDKVILTSDNPRGEDPEKIIEDILTGVEKPDFKKVTVIVNRKEAIRSACMMARPGDIILVAGKGHEKYQEINGTRYPFNDKEIIREAFNITE